MLSFFDEVPDPTKEIKLKHPKVFNKIEAVIRSIAPYFERFDLKPDRNNEQQIKLEWVENGSDMYMDGHSFSDGTLRFIALTTLETAAS